MIITKEPSFPRNEHFTTKGPRKTFTGNLILRLVVLFVILNDFETTREPDREVIFMNKVPRLGVLKIKSILSLITGLGKTLRDVSGRSKFITPVTISVLKVAVGAFDKR